MLSKLFKAVTRGLIEGFTYHPVDGTHLLLSIGGQNKRTKRRIHVGWKNVKGETHDDWDIYLEQQIVIMLNKLGREMEQDDLVEKVRAL